MENKLKLAWGIFSDKRLIGNGYGYRMHNEHLYEALDKLVDFDGDAEHVVTITSPEFFTPIPDRDNWLFTMFEGTILPKVYKDGISKANYLLVPSTWVRDLFGRWFDKNRIFVVPHGIDKDFTLVNRGYPKFVPFRYLWVGAANPRKGWVEIIAAWDSVFSKDSTTELYLKTTSVEESKELAEKFDFQHIEEGIWKKDNVILDARNVSEEELVKLYHDAHCFVFPSRGEGWGMTLGEAMATGLPCIATNFSGHTDFFNNLNGYPIGYSLKTANMTMAGVEVGDRERSHTTVCAYPDVQELIGAMIYARIHYNESLALGREASKTMKNFTWGASARTLINIIKTHGGDKEKNHKTVNVDRNPAKRKVMTFTGYKRPKYTQQVIDGLRSCDGIEDYKLFARLEPGYPEVVDVIKSINFMECEYIINDCRLGCNDNYYQALSRGFEAGDFVVQVEDDTVPTKDFLRYMEWAQEKYKDDKEVFTICGYNKIDKYDSATSHDAFKNPWFTPWGWATWADRWKEIEKQWDSELGKSWDIFMNETMRKDRYEIRPTLGRIQNVGAEGGEFCPSKEFHEANQLNKIWAGTEEYEQGVWKLV